MAYHQIIKAFTDHGLDFDSPNNTSITVRSTDAFQVDELEKLLLPHRFLLTEWKRSEGVYVSTFTRQPKLKRLYKSYFTWKPKGDEYV